ncbi:hypothetical protein ACQKWADRAFT_318066 [Trichoderma austrokoningii]
MGPPGVSASVAAVLQLATTVTQYLEGGEAERARLRDGVRSTVCLLEMLLERKPQGVDSLSGLDGPLLLFRQVLEDIVAKFGRLAEPVAWPFDGTKVAELLACLERVNGHFDVALRDNIAQLAGLKLDNVESPEARCRDTDTHKIINWLSPLSFRARHVSILASVQPGTGAWLLKHEIFRRWIDSKARTLWCPGIPGAGKTRLSSLVINHLEKEPPQAHSFCSYIYCDYRQRGSHSNAALLSSILQQVLQSSAQALPSEVATLYSQHQKYSTRPTLTQITDVLGKMVSTFESFHVIIDALDECAESSEEALRFVTAVSSLGSSVKIMCTSRSSRRFDAYFSDALTIKISAHSDDISTYLDACMRERRIFSKHVRKDPTLKDDIIKTIVQKSKGMFLLAKLHIDSLSKTLGGRQVRAALASLPETLDAMYADAYERMANQETESAEMAEAVLFWVICSRRDLTVRDLQQVYATQELSDGELLAELDLPDDDLLIEACGGLITVDAESQIVRLVHYTAQQFFEKHHKLLVERARLTLARISLKYLTLPNFSSGACITDDDMSFRLEQNQFLEYAAKYWGVEIAQIDSAEIIPKLDNLISSSTALEAANQAWSLKTDRCTNWSQDFHRNVPALVMVSAFDAQDILRYMISSKGHAVDGRGDDGETALMRSAAFGHANNVQVLLELGAEVDAQDHADETALQRAARCGHEDVISVLLEKGADVNLKASGDWTALMSAVSSANIDAAKMLMEAGADIRAETEWGDSALSIATRDGLEAVANLLLDKGAVLPKGPAGRRASLIASRKGLHQIVRKPSASYDTVADKPLRRQSSRLMQGLNAIQEEELAASSMKRPEADDFLDALKETSYSTGFSTRYDMEEKLGKGHFAEVFLCSNRVTGVRHAVKVCKCTNAADGRAKREGIITEIKALQVLRKNPHPNILSIVDLFADSSVQTIYMVLELAPHGELFNYIVAKQFLSEEQTRKIFFQLFSALEFMHELGWVHRDIKPENILLLEEETLAIKIADFGLAKQIGAQEEAPGLTTTLCGTPSYVAPEVLQEGPERRRYGFAVDIWSCGVVMYICLCGFPPFSDELCNRDFPYTLAQQITEGRFEYPSPYWDKVSDPALDLIDSMLVVNWKCRFTARQCLEHPWTRDVMPRILAEPIRSASPEPM